ncbi:hypothetical protein OS493_025264 [Desmophyllum pertusum]|uniref:Uncharacterized protein n=1 Tax=Desmophyllum pertusum TaxID=174260 RepID=A0A9W9ZD43_9CNID|nr:hypothetical protein OS493_025264 [Desmophyllum pertusum]
MLIRTTTVVAAAASLAVANLAVASNVANLAVASSVASLAVASNVASNVASLAAASHVAAVSHAVAAIKTLVITTNTITTCPCAQSRCCECPEPCGCGYAQPCDYGCGCGWGFVDPMSCGGCVGYCGCAELCGCGLAGCGCPCEVNPCCRYTSECGGYPCDVFAIDNEEPGKGPSKSKKEQKGDRRQLILPPGYLFPAYRRVKTLQFR